MLINTYNTILYAICDSPSRSAVSMLDCCPSDIGNGNQSNFSTTSSVGNTSLSDSLPASFLAMDQSRHTAFMLNNSPLAALHNMTEMKVPASGALCTGLPQYTTQSSAGSTINASIKNPYLATPHSITDILGRPYSMAQLHALGMNPHFDHTGAAGMYFNNQVAAAARFAGKSAAQPLGELSSRLPIHWTGVGPSWRSGIICR